AGRFGARTWLYRGADRRGRGRGVRRLRPVQGSQGAALLGATARFETAAEAAVATVRLPGEFAGGQSRVRRLVLRPGARTPRPRGVRARAALGDVAARLRLPVARAARRG